MLDDYLSTAEAASRLGLSAISVARLCRERKLRAEKFGDQWFIPQDALDDPAFLARRPGRPCKQIVKEQS